MEDSVLRRRKDVPPGYGLEWKVVVVKLAGLDGSGGLLRIRSGVADVEGILLSGGGLMTSGLGVPG